MILEKNTSLMECPNCGFKGLDIIEKIKSIKRKRHFRKNGISHVHNNGIQSERVKCVKCGCTFIQTYKDECWTCGYNKRFKSIIIILKRGKNMNELCKIKGHMFYTSKRKDVKEEDGIWSVPDEKRCARCGKKIKIKRDDNV